MFGADVRVLYRIGEDVADQRVALVVDVRDFRECAPRSDVVPAEVRHRDDGGAFGFLHHRVVDRDVRAGGEHVCVEADEVVVALGGFEREFCLAGDFRCMAMQFLHVRGRLQHEHAAVPVVVAVAEEAFGGGGVGFFDECVDLVDLLAIRDGRAATDIAETGVRFRWRDAERDEMLVCCDCRCLSGRRDECGLVEDDVIRRQHQKQCIRRFMQGEQRGDRDRGRGVAAYRLEHDRRRRDVDLAELFRDQEALFVVGDDDGGGGTGDVLKADRRLLDERLITRQLQVLLRIAAARHRPKAGAAAAAKNYRMNVHEEGPELCRSMARAGTPTF